MDKGISENKFIEIQNSDIKVNCCYRGPGRDKEKKYFKNKETKETKETKENSL